MNMALFGIGAGSPPWRAGGDFLPDLSDDSDLRLLRARRFSPYSKLLPQSGISLVGDAGPQRRQDIPVAPSPPAAALTPIAPPIFPSLGAFTTRRTQLFGPLANLPASTLLSP
jgi:hypothetical protein